MESLAVLAGGIAHDFNNLLMTILGNASLLLGELSRDDAMRTDLKQIESAALRAAELTQQMLAYSGKGRFVVEPMDLNELISKMRGHTPCYAVPNYVVDAPGGGGKIALLPEADICRDGDDWLLRNFAGEQCRYPDPQGPLGKP